MQNADHVKLLDCTLRDGGYYNGWDFEPTLVRMYLTAMASAKIDAVELGFRNPYWPGFVGKYAYTRPEHIPDPTITGDIFLGTMTDTKAVVSKEGQVDVALLRQLYPGENDPVKFVRLATRLQDLAHAARAAEELTALGYQTFINVMQCSGLTEEALRDVGAVLRGHKLAGLYLADSLGSLTPTDTALLIQRLRKYVDVPIGFHAHDNLGLATANALSAMESGAVWIDGTLTGMGRGAGNARTEHLVPLLRLAGRADLSPEHLATVLDEGFRPLQKRYDWGPSLAFGLAAQAQIHPTYAQKLLAGRRYNANEVIRAIEALKRAPNRASYSEETLLKARSAANGWESGGQFDVPAIRNALQGAQGRALIIGTGPSTSRYWDGISAFAKSCGVVIATNEAPFTTGGGPGYRAALHRRHADAIRGVSDEIPIIHPFSDAEGAALFPERGRLQVPCRLARGLTDDGPLAVPSDVVGMYAMEICRRSGAKSLFLAGFDGYGPGSSIEKDPDAMTRADLLNSEMNQYMRSVMGPQGSCRIAALTPTWYDVPLEALYGPRT